MRRRHGITGAAVYAPWVLEEAPRAEQQQFLAALPAPVRVIARLVWEPSLPQAQPLEPVTHGQRRSSTLLQPTERPTPCDNASDGEHSASWPLSRLRAAWSVAQRCVFITAPLREQCAHEHQSWIEPTGRRTGADARGERSESENLLHVEREHEEDSDEGRPKEMFTTLPAASMSHEISSVVAG